MLRFFLAVVVLLTVFALLPVFPVQSTERRPTMLEVDLEVFQHVEYPCHAFKMIQIAKKWKATPGTVHKLGRNALTAALLVTSEKALTEEGDQMTANRIKDETGIDLRSLEKKERVVTYHIMLSACIAAHYGWEAENVQSEGFIKALSMTGW